MTCCTKCFFDIEIRTFIQSDEEIGECDYCRHTDIHVADVDAVGAFVMDGILRKYEDAAKSVPFESREGGYQLPTLELHEILKYWEAIFSDTIDERGKIDELIETLVHPDGTPYVVKNPFSSTGGIEEITSWKEFCKLIKKKRRFTAFWNIEPFSIDKDQPGYFIHMFQRSINDEALRKLFNVGDKIYRARIYEEGFKPSNKSLTSPPRKKAKASRMSPAGISLFYGSLDEKTCIAEVRPAVGDKVIVGQFSVKRPLMVLDLSQDLNQPTSIFSEDYYFDYEEYIRPFLAHFITDIAKPIRFSDTAIEYLPTQAITEFIRLHTGSNVEGLMYKSSLAEKGVNLAFFRGPSIATDDEKNDKAWLFFEDWKKYKVSKVELSCKTCG